MAFKIIKEAVYAENDVVAVQVRKIMSTNKVLMVNIISSPGSGKTTMIEALAPVLKKQGIRAAIIAGDCYTAKDAERIDAAGLPVIQINTGNACHINAELILKAVRELDCTQLDCIFVENVGNLVCPAEFDIGEDCKIALVSVAEGDSKPVKYPLLFIESDVVCITKLDLLPHTDFNCERCIQDIRGLNKKAVIIQMASKEGKGIETLVEWLNSTITQKKESV